MKQHSPNRTSLLPSQPTFAAAGAPQHAPCRGKSTGSRVPHHRFGQVERAGEQHGAAGAAAATVHSKLQGIAVCGGKRH